jgi:Membrane carboxypeptidase/penicillin-binding protein
MSSRIQRLALAGFASAAFAASAGAQTTNMSASATVVTPLTVTKVTDIVYGNVYPGLDKIISGSVNSNLMGKFTVSGFSGATVYISFSLPTSLAGSGTAAGFTLPIDTWNGYQGVGATQNTGGAVFTPSVSNSSIVLGASASNVFVGATVHPTYTQVAGPYTGTITMTTVYSGS